MAAFLLNYDRYIMEKTRAYSSVQFNLPNEISEKIITWGDEHIPDDDIFLDIENHHYGREDEIHVTVLFGIHTGQPQQIENIFKQVKPFTFELGRTNVFRNSGVFDVVMINVVNSPCLHDLNSLLESKLSFTNKFKEYHPHVTIAYVKKGNGWKFGGKNEFEGIKIKVDQVIFSSKDGGKTKIKLGA